MTTNAGSGTRGTKGMPRTDREDLILRAASIEFAKATFSGAQLATIAARAGVSRTLVLSYFGSKAGLYAALVDRAGERITSRIAEVLSESAGPAVADYAGVAGAALVLDAIFSALTDSVSDWAVIHDPTVPDGVAADAAERQRRHLREQAVYGVGRSLRAVGLTDDDDLAAATTMWEASVTALIGWWGRHPDYTAEQMSARAARIVAALGGSL